MSFEHRVFWTLISRIGLAAFGLVSGVILARGLGPDGKGAYELVVLVCAFGVSWGGLSVDLAVTYFAGKGTFADRDLKSVALWFGAVWGSAVGLIALLVTRSLGDSVLRGVDSDLLLLAVALIPIVLMLNYQRAYLLGRNRLRAYNGLNLGLAAISCLLFLGSVYWLRAGLSGAIGAYALAQVMALGLVVRLSRPSVARFSAGAVGRSVAVLRELLKLGGKVQCGQALLYLSYRADLFIVNLFLGTAAVGHYSVAVALAEVVWFIPRTVALVLLPYVAASDRRAADSATPTICRQTMLLSLLAALGLAALGPPVINILFGEAFQPAVVPLWLLLPGIVASSWVRPLASYHLGQGRPLVPLYVALLSAPVCVAAYVLLIPPFGIVGAAVASSVSYALIAAAELYVLSRVSSLRLAELLVPRRTDLALYRTFLVGVRRSLAQVDRHPRA